MSDRYEVLRPFITEKINALVRGRLFEGLLFFEANRFRSELCSRGEAKLALLLVRLAHEKEPFTDNEAELMVAKMRQQKVGESEEAPSETTGQASSTQIKARPPKRQKPGLTSPQ